MALDFPNNPTVNQQFPAPNGVTYVWDGVKWSVLTGSGGGGGGVPSQITGPLTVGGSLPSPAPVAGTLVADQISNRISPAGLLQETFNAYTDATGTTRYLDNGPAAGLGVHASTVAGAVFPRFAINVAPNNNAGPGALTGPFSPAMELVIGDPSGGTAPFLLLGPATNVPPVSAFPLQNTFIADQLAIRSVTTTANTTDPTSYIGLNTYVTADGATYYLGNGAAGLIDCHTRNTGLSIISIGPYDVNNSGPSLVPSSGAGGLQVVFGEPGQPAQPFVVIGRGLEVPTGPFPGHGSLIARGALMAAADPLTGSTDRVSRIGLNALEQKGPVGGWYYLADGPAVQITVHDANSGPVPQPWANFQIGVADAGTTNSYISWTGGRSLILFGASALGTDQTAMMLMVNHGGTVEDVRVTLGAPNSGGAGLRALTVPN